MKIRSVLLILAAGVLGAIGCKKEKKEVFATVTTAAVTGITGSAAVTGGTVTNTGNSGISQIGIVYATHTAPTLTDSLRNSTTGGSTFSINLANLNANTVYYVKAFAINATGTAYGNEVTFTTAKGLATVTTTTVTNISAAAATGSSGGNVVNDGGAPITGRGVCWSSKPHPTITGNATTDNTGTGTFTSTLSLLAANTIYYYRAYATNSFGTAYGNELSFNAGSTATVQDIDGNVYNTITINGQTWMSENLKVSHYQNGDPIANGLTGFNWSTSTTGAYTFPNGDSTQNAVFGKLYSVFAINDSRNIAPKGWHVSTDADWEQLEFYEGMAAIDTATLNTRGTIGAKFLTGGSTGLNLQYSGIFYPIYGHYYVFGTQGYFATSTTAIPNYNYGRGFNTTGDPAPIWRNYVQYAMSVRCVKN
jgi:uncharacterized protein (TIGR02145 family)